MGYAFVRVGPGTATWDIGERVAELESLSVAAQARGAGVGAALVREARAFAGEGFRPFYVLLVERPED